ncbi:MAG TPA: hypothetical protein VNS46_12590 [Nocardioides sp.]|nr:hypothetical protein [Nocardioides sp.]
MSTRTTTTRRVLAATALASATIVGLPSPGARAADPVTGSVVVARVGAYHHELGCSTSVANANEAKAVPPTGAAVDYQVNRTAMVADDSNGTSTTITQAAKATASVGLASGQLAALDLAVSGGVTLDAPAHQLCGSHAWTSMDQNLEFTLSAPRWLTLTTTATKGTDVWADLWSHDGDTQIGMYGDATGGTTTATYYLLPGRYDFESSVGWSATSLAGETGVKRYGSGSVRARLFAPGSAYAPASGPGGAYVAMGSQVSCTLGTLPVAFRSNAARVKQAIYYVDGRAVRTVRRPAAGQRVQVPGMAGYARKRVTVRLVVDPPGSATTATVSVNRAYRPCKVR